MIRWISIIDMLSFPESKKVLLEGSAQEFEKLLYEIGFKCDEDLEYQVCLHRPLSYIAANKNPINTGRWIGNERTDVEWQNSGYCTRENKLELIGRKDLEFQKELVAMGSYPNFTGMVIEHIKGNSAKSDRGITYANIEDLEEGEV